MLHLAKFFCSLGIAAPLMGMIFPIIDKRSLSDSSGKFSLFMYRVGIYAMLVAIVIKVVLI